MEGNFGNKKTEWVSPPCPGKEVWGADRVLFPSGSGTLLAKGICIAKEVWIVKKIWTVKEAYIVEEVCIAKGIAKEDVSGEGGGMNIFKGRKERELVM